MSRDVHFLAALLLVSLLLAVLMAQWFSFRRSGKGLASLRDQMQSVRELMPHTTRELRCAFKLAITAGICEEILFRGLLIWYFSQFTGAWTALSLAVLVFGAAHLYQGWRRAAKCTALGLLLALLYVWSGSLLAPILLHVAVDVQAMALSRLVLQEDNPKLAAPTC